MIAYDVFRLYLGLKLHFNSNTYDYFKYNGNVSAKEDAFLKRKDKAYFLRISRMREPFNVMVGNFLFNSKDVGWIGGIREEFGDEFSKFIENGEYLFAEDLKKIDKNFNRNFIVDDDNSTPYLLQLYMNEVISLHTCCIFDTLLSCYDKWQKKDTFIIFENTAKKIHKAAPFFGEDVAKYKSIVRSHFAV